MSALDPHDASAVAEVLRQRVAARWGDVTLAEPPSSVGAGFDSYIHLVRLAGVDLPSQWQAPLVVRLLPSRDREPQSHREAAAQSWALSVGYRAPLVLDVVGPDDGFGLPAQVMERAPGTTMLDALKAKPWRAFRLADQLARLQLELHALPTDAWPGGRDVGELFDQRLSMPRRAGVALGNDDLTHALERAEALREVATSGPLVVCHGDFHPLNVMVSGDEASVIDWTDAGLGPREGDVARTRLIFHIASIAASSAVERVALRAVGPRLAGRYWRTYTAVVPLDPERLRVWEALHALHGWAQVLTLHAGGFAGASSAEEGRIPVEVGDFLRARFERALSS